MIQFDPHLALMMPLLIVVAFVAEMLVLILRESDDTYG